jgi:hypothetical protein
MLSLGTGGAGGWFATISRTITLTLAMATRKGLSGVVARNQRSREEAKKGDILVAGITFDREARLKANGDVPLLEGDGISRRRGGEVLVG